MSNIITNKLDHLIILCTAICLTIMFTVGRKEMIIELSNSRSLQFGTGLMVLFIFYYMIIDPQIRSRTATEEKNVKQSILAGLFSFLLALMAELHLIVPAFFIGFTAAYYYNS